MQDLISKLSQTSNSSKRPGFLSKKLKPLTTITLKVFETNSSFHVKAHNGKKLTSVFKKLSGIINKTYVLAKGLSTRISFYEV